jgi:hypothetical protein
MDRALASGAKGRGFESLLARHILKVQPGRSSSDTWVTQRTGYIGDNPIGQGPKIEDVLFQWKITGHYRYYGPSL